WVRAPVGVGEQRESVLLSGLVAGDQGRAVVDRSGLARENRDPWPPRGLLSAPGAGAAKGAGQPRAGRDEARGEAGLAQAQRRSKPVGHDRYPPFNPLSWPSPRPSPPMRQGRTFGAPPVSRGRGAASRNALASAGAFQGPGALVDPWATNRGRLRNRSGPTQS